MDIQRRFDNAIDELYKTNHFLAAEITKLGYPKMVRGYPPTAGVMWDKARKKICFMFNEKFAEKVNDEEFMFTVAHETRHVIGGHIFFLRDEIDKLERLNEPKKKINRFAMKFNKAADCVVNDSLVNLYKFPKCFSTKEDMFQACYGKEMVGVDCQDLTAMDVFYLLPEAQEGEDDVENHEGWKSFMNEDGTMDKGFVDAVKNFIEDNMDNSALSDEEMEQVDKIKESMENSLDTYTQQAGNTAVGKSRSIGSVGNESLKWSHILSHFVETKKIEDVWNRPHRKLVSTYPDVILPTSKYKEKQEIFVAIDSSGSIDYNALRLFATVLKNSPGNLDIRAISFDTMCYEYDVKGDDPPKGGGGTAFHIIENYIQTNLKKYPKAVFVLTDGHGSPVNPEFPNRWCWILYGHYITTYCDTMKHYQIGDLLK